MVLVIFLALIILFVVLPLVGVALWFILTTVISGLVFGALGRLIIPGQQPIGFLATVASGWIGSFIGGLIGRGVWGSHHHRIATVLLEIAFSAATVAVWSGRSRRAIGHSRPHRVIDV